MRQWDGWFLLSQPKYRIPGIFDLHLRGTFRERPSVLTRCGARILVNEGFGIAVEYRFLIEKNSVIDGAFCTHVTSQGLLILDENMTLDLNEMSKSVTDKETRDEIQQVYDQWCREYIPFNAQGETDGATLKEKLKNSLIEIKRKVREELKRKNGAWVAARAPALTGQFFRWQQGQIADELFEAYGIQGGEDTERGLINKMAQFMVICDTVKPDGLERQDGSSWSNEDEMWECWVGFAGSEEEAKRVLGAMDMVFRR